MTMKDRIPQMFLAHAADVLGDTALGLSGANIVRVTSKYAVEYGVEIPHQACPFEAGNKRTALLDNLLPFAPAQQFEIIRALCDHPQVIERNPEGARKLKLQLVTRYSHFAAEPLGAEINESLVEDTRHWLQPFPDAQRLYLEALEKYGHDVYERNVLDDLRLALETLLHAILRNDKSLENQIPILGAYVKDRGGSSEFGNMFVKLIDYYCKYQNRYVKHNDAVIEEEVEFVFEITSSFMKHVVRLSAR